MQGADSRIIVPDRPRLREAAERVVHLYEIWGEREQAELGKPKAGMPDLRTRILSAP
jgi:hypothetical protein